MIFGLGGEREQPVDATALSLAWRERQSADLAKEYGYTPGQKVAVHVGGGEVRVGTIMNCFLKSKEGEPADPDAKPDVGFNIDFGNDETAFRSYSPDDLAALPAGTVGEEFLTKERKRRADQATGEKLARNKLELGSPVRFRQAGKTKEGVLVSRRGEPLNDGVVFQVFVEERGTGQGSWVPLTDVEPIEAENPT